MSRYLYFAERRESDNGLVPEVRMKDSSALLHPWLCPTNQRLLSKSWRLHRRGLLVRFRVSFFRLSIIASETTVKVASEIPPDSRRSSHILLAGGSLISVRSIQLLICRSLIVMLRDGPIQHRRGSGSGRRRSVRVPLSGRSVLHRGRVPEHRRS